jgi:hypothetical protein
MQSRVSATELDGKQTLRILEALEAFRSATEVGLASVNAVPEAWSDMSASGLEVPPAGLREVVEAHAEIERRLNTSVVVPVSYTPDEVRDTLETAALLRGETVAQTWEERQWPVSEAEATDLLDGIFGDDGAAVMELEEDWQWSIGTTEVPIGKVAVTYRSVRVLAVKSSRGSVEHVKTLVLAPGADNRLVLRLVQVGSDPEEDSDQRWFWEPAWQAREAEVDRLVATGSVRIHDDASAMFEHLDKVADTGDAD